MSLPRPTGLKAPSKITRPGTGVPRPSGIVPPGSGSGSRAQSALAKSARAAGLSAGQAEKYALDHMHKLRGGPESSPQPAGTDDLKIGDRVWVSGTKPGVIAFIGEAQFAPGEWAGVALDEPIGKNDGSVAGVRYFQCEPMKGVFSRLSKLSRTPGGPTAAPQKAADASSDTHSNSTSQGSVQNGSVNHTPARSTTPRIGLSASKSKSGSNVSLNKDSPTGSLHRGGLAMTKHGVKIGDRVIVSGTKTGVLRYVGQTDFAKGEWAGVELDDPQGKNDGAVAGKRYFDCRPNFGLFAPIHKVSRYAGGATPSPQSRSLANTSLRSARERSGSQESISSVSSTASSVSRSRVRLGVTSLANQASKTGQRPSTLNLSATTSALQKALKEKEEHIEQLLRERDLERAEVARAAAKVDEAEGALVSERHDKDMIMADTEDQIRQLRELVLELEKDKKGLAVKLEEEKRKVEDLQFQIEEEVISKDDLECRTEEDEEKMRSLERNHKKEKERADKLEQELQALKDMVGQQQKKLKESDDTQTTYLDQMEELTYKLNQAENKIKTFESNRLEEGAKTSQVSMDLEEKTNRVTELEESLSAQKKEIKILEDKLVEVKDELTDTNNKKQKMQDTITEMTNKLEASEKAQTKMSEEVRSMKSKGSDLQRQLVTSKEKVEELTDDRNKLEAQLSDLMKNSGDSSKQLSLMNDQVAEKTRKIEELQNDLSSSTQKVAILNESIEQLKAEGEKEKEEIVNRGREELKAAETRIEDVQTELSRTKSKLEKLVEESTQEKQELEGKKEGEVADLKKQLATSAEELEKERLQTQAHKQVLDQITLERETMKFEKEKAEKSLKRVESEKDAVNSELVQARVELSKLQTESQQSSSLKSNMEEQIQIAQEDKERALQAKKELQKQYEDSQSEKEKIVSEKNQLQQDAIATTANIQKKDIQIEELQKEVEKLKGETNVIQKELMEKSQSESDNSTLNKNLEESQKQLVSVQTNLKEVEAEKLKLVAEVEQLQLVQEDRNKLEEQNKTLQSEMQETSKRFSDEKSSLEASKAALQTKVDNSSKELSQKQKHLEEYIKKVGDLESENLSLSSYKSSASKKEKEHMEERNQLMDKVHSLEALVKESQNNANNIAPPSDSGDPEVVRLKADKDASEKQVEFLNSVIVELQRKNEELQVRLQAMESGVFDNGDAVEGMDISPSRSRTAPRLFCDICEVFDQHDTDDCPKQAMSESPPATHYHGDRKSTRPYCDICEDDVRLVEGMSNPNTPETSYRPPPRGMADHDRERHEKAKRTTHSTSEKHRSKTTSGKDLTAQRSPRTPTSKRPKLRKSAEMRSPTDPLYVTKTHATMKTRLANELGCEAGDIGDIRPRTLYRLLSTESTDEDPLHILRLQQAILRADKAIQDQSWCASLGSPKGRHGLGVKAGSKADRSSKDKKRNVKHESKFDNKIGKKHGSNPNLSTSNKKDDTRKVKKSVRTPKGSQTDLREACDMNEYQSSNNGTPCSIGTPSFGTPMDSIGIPMDSIGTPMGSIGTPSVGTPSVCSVTSGLEELIEGLQDLDYPDWYNEECDAEVASLELGNRGDQAKSDSKPTEEDEELKLFEELEAKLAEEKEDTDVIKKSTAESLVSSVDFKDGVISHSDVEDIIKKTSSETMNSCEIVSDKAYCHAKQTDGQVAMEKTSQLAHISCQEEGAKAKDDEGLKEETVISEKLPGDPLSLTLEELDKNKKASLDDEINNENMDKKPESLPSNKTDTNEIKNTDQDPNSDTNAKLDTFETEAETGIVNENPNTSIHEDRDESEYSDTRQAKLVSDNCFKHTTTESHHFAKNAIDGQKSVDDSNRKASQEDDIKSDKFIGPDEVVNIQDAVVKEANEIITKTSQAQERSDHVDCVDVEPENTRPSTPLVDGGDSYDSSKESPKPTQYNTLPGKREITDTISLTEEPKSNELNVNHSTSSSSNGNLEAVISGQLPFESESSHCESTVEQEAFQHVLEDAEGAPLEDVTLTDNCNRLETIQDQSTTEMFLQAKDIKVAKSDALYVQSICQGDEPFDERVSPSLENPANESPTPKYESHDITQLESECSFDTEGCNVSDEINSLHFQQPQSDSALVQGTENELSYREMESKGKMSTETSKRDSQSLNSSVVDDVEDLTLPCTEPFCTAKPESESFSTTKPESRSIAASESESICTNSLESESIFITPSESESTYITPPENESICHTQSECESLSASQPDSESVCTTPPKSESPFDTPPCITPPETVSPCVTPAESTSPCVTPPEGPSPCVTPPLDTCPSIDLDAPASAQHDQEPVDVEKDPVTRRSKKGRSSPAKRASVPAPTDTPTSEVKSKTESCVVC